MAAAVNEFIIQFAEAADISCAIIDSAHKVIWCSAKFKSTYPDNDLVNRKLPGALRDIIIEQLKKGSPNAVEALVFGRPSTIKALAFGDNDNTNTMIIASLTEGESKKQQTAGVRELMLNNVRIGIINEKLQALQSYASTIINYHDLDLIFTTLLDYLTDRSKFSCQDATIYFVDKNGEKRTWGSTALLKRIFKDENPPQDAAKLAEVLSRSNTGPRRLIPLNVNNSITGVVAVAMNKVEFDITKENQIFENIYAKIFRSVMQLTGTAVENAYARESLFLQSIIDPLTGVYNRRYLESKLAEEYARAKRYKRYLSIALLDLNKFKAVNDKYGHDEGDKLLREVATLLKQSIRSVDVLARYGGDEFILLLPETSATAMQKKIKMLKSAVKNAKFSIAGGKKKVHVGVSIGSVTMQKSDTRRLEDLLREVDKEMYKDKLASR